VLSAVPVGDRLDPSIGVVREAHRTPRWVCESDDLAGFVIFIANDSCGRRLARYAITGTPLEIDVRLSILPPRDVTLPIQIERGNCPVTIADSSLLSVVFDLRRSSGPAERYHESVSIVRACLDCAVRQSHASRAVPPTVFERCAVSVAVGERRQ